MQPIAKIRTETLTDNSEVYNVIIFDDTGRELVKIGAEDAGKAIAITDAINRGAAYVESQL